MGGCSHAHGAEGGGAECRGWLGQPDGFVLSPLGNFTAMWERRSGAIVLVDNDTGEHLRRWQGHARGTVSFSPDGSELRSMPSAAAAAAAAASTAGQRRAGAAQSSGELAWNIVSGEMARLPNPVSPTAFAPRCAQRKLPRKHCTALYRDVLYCTVLYRTVLYCTALPLRS